MEESVAAARPRAGLWGELKGKGLSVSQSARKVLFLLGLIAGVGIAAGATAPARKPAAKPPAKQAAAKTGASTQKRARRPSNGRWSEPSFADSTLGDRIDGEDLTVRRAAVEALAGMNGTVVVADPGTGRLLSIVNQKLAFKSGFQPCSTIKIVAALAALSEGIIERTTQMRVYGRTTLNLTEALAHSNNPYFAHLGVKLGFERVGYYARLFGLGERAGLNIPAEQPGVLPDEPPANGGVGMMTSFGEGILLTPLELAGLMSAVANGGTLYYLQYPQTQDEVRDFVPRVKRRLDLQQWIPEIKPGMMGAVEFGTARRAAYDPNEPIYGKTGTCTDRVQPGVHLGWFGAFNDVGGRKLVVVVLLTGGRPVNGPAASGVAGAVYRNLSQQRFFLAQRGLSPSALISSGSCCAQ
ncbi:MAG: penicillin-binding protein [Acidobacteria bacterium]|nr:penicillin-binding protein [Acidobacteriota bacterium]